MEQGPEWHEQGEEPDYRFSLANERTFLAWVRTALAILAGAILLHEFAAHIQPAAFIAATAPSAEPASGIQIAARSGLACSMAEVAVKAALVS